MDFLYVIISYKRRNIFLIYPFSDYNTILNFKQNNTKL